MTLNSVTQSNYGVGNTNVTYTLNLTVPMTPLNPKITVRIPEELAPLTNAPTSLNFYNT